MKNTISFLLSITMFFTLISTQMQGQTFKFPTIESAPDCYFGSYELSSEIKVVGIRIKDVYYDDSLNDVGSFGFEVLFTYNNLFLGSLPEVGNFWKYQVSFESTNSKVQPAFCTNNLNFIPTSTMVSGVVDLANNNTFTGSAKRLGLQAHTDYFDQGTIDIFGFIKGELEVSLPCMSTKVETISEEMLSPLSVNIVDFKAISLTGGNEVKFSIEENESIIDLEIQKSNNGQDWKSIKSYSPNDLKNVNFTTTYLDGNVNAFPLAYYRLAINANHEISYSKTLMIQSQSTLNNDFKLYPNPAYDYITIDVKGQTIYIIHDAKGNVLKNGNIDPMQNRIYVSDLNNGTYYLNIEGQKQALPFTIIK